MKSTLAAACLRRLVITVGLAFLSSLLLGFFAHPQQNEVTKQGAAQKSTLSFENILEAGLNVRTLKRSEYLQSEWEATFPELARSPFWGVTEVYDAKSGSSTEYFIVPLYFLSMFIQDQQDSEVFKQQRQRLLSVDSLQGINLALMDSLLVLEERKALAYKMGFDEAYAKYDTLSQKYINLLKNPPRR